MNGLILQWGSITFFNETEKDVAFSIIFKNGFRTFSSGQNIIIGATASYGYGPLTNFKIMITNLENTNRSVDWFAIGL